jgi:hypothetical protein
MASLLGEIRRFQPGTPPVGASIERKFMIGRSNNEMRPLG